MNKKIAVLAVLFSVCFALGCSGSREDSHGIPGDIPSDILMTLEAKDIQSLRVYQGRELKWSYDQEGWDSSAPHIIHSCTKSIISLLIGTLIDDGTIDSVDVPVVDLFPRLDVSSLPETAKELQLKHLLTMTTGLRSRDSYLYGWEGLRAVWGEPDWVEALLRLKQEKPPGERFDYSNLASFTLGAVIQSLTGKDPAVYAREKLFSPLGITAYEWDVNPYGVSIGWGGLHLLPEDLAKIGFLVSADGRWGEEQIVSAQWIAESTSPKIRANTLRESYGYQWWIDQAGRIYGLGYQGQYLIIDREQDLVTVFASTLEDRDFFLPYEMYKKQIAPEFKR